MKHNLECNSIIILFFLVLLLPYAKSQAQSFEGTMFGKIKERDVHLFIWVDLSIPKYNGIVKGSYFYKTIGKEISILGKKEGNQISFIEKDKNQKVTGIFVLKVFTGNIKGFWYQPNKKDTLQVELYSANPTFRKTAKIPKLNDLLKEDIEFYSSGLDSTLSEQSVNYSVLFARSNLLSVELIWENYSYTAHYGTIHHSYNLATSEVINLKDEITDSCQSYLCKVLQEIVTSHREEYSDSEWIDGLHPYVEGYDSYKDSSQEYRNAVTERINGLFTVSSLPEKTELYMDKDGLTCYIEDYCEQYYGAGNRGMTFDCVVNIPFDKLRLFIKKESILQNLFYY